MKSIVQGAEAEPMSGNRYRIKQLSLKTFRVTGETETAAEAPECLYDSADRLVSSTNHVRLQTGDKRFLIEGDGFLWLQTNANFFISNRVHTIVRKQLLLAKAGTPVEPSATATNAEEIEILSDYFSYDRKSGLAVYQDNVRGVGTNWTMRCGTLSVKVPEAGESVESLTAEHDVILDREDAHATGEQAVYSVADDVVTLTGHPAWRLDKREGRGDEIVIDRTNNIFRATGHAYLKLPREATGSVGLFGGMTQTNALAATNQIIEISSDQYQLHTNTAVFRGNVRAAELADTQTQGTLNCGTMTVFMAGTNQVQSVIAQNSVVVEQSDSRFTGNRAVFTATNSTAEFTGSPRWRIGTREGTGDRLLLNQATEQMLVRGNAYMKLPRRELGAELAATNETPVLAASRTNQFAEIFSDEYQLQRTGAVFHGNVRVDDPQMRLASESLMMESAEGGKPNRIVAERTVEIDFADASGKKTRATGQRAVYTLADNVLELRGEPMLKSEQGSVTGEVIYWHRTNDTVVVKNYRVRGLGSAVTNLFVRPKPLKKR